MLLATFSFCASCVRGLRALAFLITPPFLPSTSASPTLKHPLILLKPEGTFVLIESIGTESPKAGDVLESEVGVDRTLQARPAEKTRTC